MRLAIDSRCFWQEEDARLNLRKYYKMLLPNSNVNVIVTNLFLLYASELLEYKIYEKVNKFSRLEIMLFIVAFCLLV